MSEPLTIPATNMEVVINPKWGSGFMDIGGDRAIWISFEHPRLGQLSFLLPSGDAATLAAHISQILAGETRPVARENMQ